MPTFLGWSTGSFVFVGPNPFQNLTTRNGAAYNITTIELRTDAIGVTVAVADDDPQFHDTPHEISGPQTLAAPVTIGGNDYLAGDGIHAEYRYVVRSTASVDPADNFSIIVFRVDGDLIGVASTAPMVKGTTYRIQSGGSDTPDPFYTELAQPICFTPGARIDTPQGPRPVETLRAGDLVATRDGAARPILWIGGHDRAGIGCAAPVRVAVGRLGNRRALLLSPQHRVLVGQGAREVLVPVKALVDGRGVRVVPCPRVRYLHLLLDGHHVVVAEGAAVESLFPGPQACAVVAAALGSAAASGFAAARTGRDWSPARPLVRPGVFRRAMAQSA